MANYDLERFVRAQDPIIEDVKGELRSGRKTSHWMWFVFPQIRGLGSSATAREYAIESLEEARAYLDHPVLGPRLQECTRLVLAVKGTSVDAIFGSPDNLKFGSCMTLFEAASDGETRTVFAAALDTCFGGRRDSATLSRI